MCLNLFKKKTSVLILGAGASIPFFDPRLSSQSIKNFISDPVKWQDIVNRYSAIMGPNVNMVSVREVLNVLNSIIHHHPDYNFEQIIEIYDKISSFNFHPTLNSKIFHDILLHYGARAPAIANHVWDCVPFLFRQLICEEIDNLNINHRSNNYNALNTQQERFVKSISNGKCFNIFTLNYDEIILDAIQNLNFETGFNNTRFDLNLFLKSERTISFPHGHTRFSYDDDGILYHPNCTVANAYRLQHISSHDRTQTKYLSNSTYSYSFNTFISTGQQKEPTFDSNPYSIYYQKFASDCLIAHKIYIVGYSFSDSHFNRLLMNYLRINPKNKLFIIDYINGNVNVLNDYLNEDSLIHKIFSLLGASIQLDLNGVYVHQNKELELNTKGHSEIYPQIYFYKNGYDRFLNEFQNIPLL